MRRCLARGRERFQVLVGAAVLTNNLMRITDLLKDQKPVRRPMAA
jgi:IS5 family transposase